MECLVRAYLSKDACSADCRQASLAIMPLSREHNHKRPVAKVGCETLEENIDSVDSIMLIPDIANLRL